MKYSIGIDLGTTFCAVGVVDDTGFPRIVPNSWGKSLTPSVIYFGNGAPIVGEEAKERQALEGNKVASFFKRVMGDPSFLLEFNGLTYTPTDLSAILLQRLKEDAEASLRCFLDEAVITVPAYFDDFQRQATIKAGEMAGLKVLRILNEPTAAALAYGLKPGAIDKTALIYDLGGGTFDVTIARITKSSIEVIATDGNRQLGGKDWDDRVAQYLRRCFSDEYGLDLNEDSVAVNDLLLLSEDAKKQLSVLQKTSISITYSGKRGTYEISRSQFEDMSRDLMELTQALTEQVLQDAGLRWQDLSVVLPVGGSSRMPMVRDYIQRMSGRPPMTGVNVDEAVALGAAIQASIDSADRIGRSKELADLPGIKRIRDVMSHSLGTIAINKEGSRYINEKIILKNRTIPCSESKPFRKKTSPNQDNVVEVYMVQGESESPPQCTILGKYVFSGISHTKDGVAVVDIQYAYDMNGVVTVAATERLTRKKLPMHIEPVPEDMSWLDRPPEEEKKSVSNLSVVIAVDISGSMRGEPLQEAQKAAKRFVQQLDPQRTTIGLIAFADRVECTQPLCQDTKKLAHGIDVWSGLMNTGELGYGNLGQPFTKGLEMLEDLQGARFLLVLTDGVWTHQRKAIQLAEECHEEGIQIIAVGFGSADEQFLMAIATSDEHAIFTSLDDLVTSFSKIAQVMSESPSGLSTLDEPVSKKRFLSRLQGGA